MSSARKSPVDQGVRDRLTREFDKNVLVEAGAGSGKTHSLATRMAAGIAAGVYTVEHMAVVTFTRKAAAELRGRFQLALEERLRANPGPEERRRLEAALSGMERLLAGTIHSFCARLLRERPVDARIAPGFEELSDIDNVQCRRRAWRDYVAAATAAGSKAMLDLVATGMKAKDLDVAFAAVCEHEDVEFDMGRGDPPDAKRCWHEVIAFWKQVSDARPPEFREDTTCRLQQRFGEFDGRVRNGRRRQDLPSLASFIASWGSMGVTQKFWDVEVGRPKGIGKQVAELVKTFNAEVAEPFRERWRAYIHRLAMAVLIDGREFYAAERRRQNVVNYVDLLRVTAGMLRGSAFVRRALQQKYRFLFIDEFQDTDPIQAEIFLMLAGDEKADDGLRPFDSAAEEASGVGQGREAEGGRQEAEGALDPYALPLRPGALFVVGDPKQSIFRFRRADIDIYNRVAARIGETGGEVVTLTANFRSRPGVCDVANAVFPVAFGRQSEPYSPPFAALDAVREDSATAGECIATITIPAADDEEKHEEKEARRIAAYIEGEVQAGRRAYGDFLVLTRQTTRLGLFVAAFDGLRIPVDVSGAGLFCQSPEVKALAALLQALADPLDSVALVGVLRGPLCGHSDPELFQFRQARGRFELSMPLPESDDPAQAAAIDAAYGPVLASMRRLRAMWRDTRALPTAAAVERMLDTTGWLALAATTPGGAPAGHLLQAVDRVREVIEEGGGLAEAADALNEEEKSSEAEAMPLEPGRRNVVRLMNLHKAKGLEAPVVILADATHQYDFPIACRIARAANGTAVGHLRIMKPTDEPWKSTPLGQAQDWQAHEDEEKKYRDAERLRLLYVAGTRARDLLVLCRSAKTANNRAWSEFDDYFSAAAEVAGVGPVVGDTSMTRVAAGNSLTARLAVSREARERRRELAVRPSWEVTSPTAEKAEGGRREALRLAPDRASARSGQAEGDERRAEGATGETYERRVDAGAAWGALVHGLLEHAMRHPAGTRADLERLARWLTVETPELRAAIPDALALVQAMTASDGWRRAREGREVHVEAPFAIRLAAPGATADPAAGPTEEPAVPILVRGVVDLVYRAADGWHIVDYKTDVDADEFTLLERYRPQLARYRLAWERITGQPLIETRIVSAR